MENRSNCPVSCALDFVGDKWSLLIVRDLFLNVNTYSDFLKSPEKIATNILVDRLKKLRENGIIDFRRGERDKKIKYYYLTELGIDMYPITIELAMWSKKHLVKQLNTFSLKYLDSVAELGKEKHYEDTITRLKSTLPKALN